ncbi:hypothetical protein DFH09DRAFT_1311003 [Mycena vulgaris]|nr:hypothetical protein DFH09DRAFT_1328428 [Mycena vulgaris]KAJ6576986.1 hypothetical protein DFH09DRAFT_1311003 [Mycena vulgaris]
MPEAAALTVDAAEAHMPTTVAIAEATAEVAEKDQVEEVDDPELRGTAEKLEVQTRQSAEPPLSSLFGDCPSVPVRPSQVRTHDVGECTRKTHKAASTRQALPAPALAFAPPFSPPPSPFHPRSVHSESLRDKRWVARFPIQVLAPPPNVSPSCFDSRMFMDVLHITVCLLLVVSNDDDGLPAAATSDASTPEQPVDTAELRRRLDGSTPKHPDADAAS